MKQTLRVYAAALLCCLSSILIHAQAGPDDEYCSTPLGTLVADETNNVSNALAVYLDDFTVANCNAYKAAFDEYLGALLIYQERCESVLSSPAIIRMNEAIQDAELTISGIDCD
jgi:hypothetical protein